MITQHIHFIAIGGSAMHNLAIALHKKGHKITGSDDAIFDPSRSRLAKHGLLPQKTGWQPEKMGNHINAVILGMHAKKDNPELKKAKELNIPVFSYPEYLYEQTRNKKRVAIAGSHGKTTTTAMVMHVLKFADIDFDYMAGASLEGFETMVNLEEKNEIAIFEADEYLSSPIDTRSKFLWYKPHIAVITGIAWDHINVFPTFDSYLNTFSKFLDTLPYNAKLFYYAKDMHLNDLLKKHSKKNFTAVPYKGLEIESKSGNTLLPNNQTFNSPVFGEHNLQNMHAAFLILKEFGINEITFSTAMENFRGAARRLQILKNATNPIYLDFAHAPSKVEATLKAVKTKHKNQKILACLELHTFSSLNKKFIPHYKHTMRYADEAAIYFNPETLAHKNMPSLEPEFIEESFSHAALDIYTDSTELQKRLKQSFLQGKVVIIMSSGNFSGIDFNKWAANLQ